MLFGFFIELVQHLVEFAGFFAFLVQGDDGFYGVASAFKFAFGYPAVDCGNHFLGQSKLYLSHQTHRKQYCLQKHLNLSQNKQPKTCSVPVFSVAAVSPFGQQ
jgi:hypothetical protein